MKRAKGHLHCLRPYVEKVYHWHFERIRPSRQPGQQGYPCFSSMLLDLICKADSENRERIEKGFPELFLAWELWSTSEDYGKALFREYGFDIDR